MAKVLIIDDDADLLEMVSLVLTSHELEVASSTRGADLHKAIAEERPDIILMDIFLGDSDGRQLSHQLKTTDHLKQIPVVLYSAGYVNSASIDDSLADDFLVKPFNITDLIQKIRLLLPST